MNGVEVSALATLVGLMAWYLKYTTKRQAEREDKQDMARTKREEKRDTDQKGERDYYRKLIDGSLQKNTVLNAKSLDLQRGMIKDLKDHNGHTEKFSEKVVETLTLICGKLNGGSSSMVEAKKKLKKDRRKVNKKVEVERRK